MQSLRANAQGIKTPYFSGKVPPLGPHGSVCACCIQDWILGVLCWSLPSWAGISSIPSCWSVAILWKSMNALWLCYILHIPPALNLLGRENSIIFPDLYSSFPSGSLPRMLLSLCMVSAQLGEVTLPSLCGFSRKSCRDPRPGEHAGSC